MKPNIKKIIAREGLFYLSSTVVVMAIMNYLKPADVNINWFTTIIPLLLLGFYYYIPLTIGAWLIRKAGWKSDPPEYREIFYWWFYWGIKTTLIIAFLGILLQPVTSKLQPLLPIKLDIAEQMAEQAKRDDILVMCTGVALVISIGIMFGLIAVGIKKIKDDELLRFWKK